MGNVQISLMVSGIARIVVAPGNIAIGRRKGPLGDKSQCGTCGEFSRMTSPHRPLPLLTVFPRKILVSPQKAEAC